MSSTKILVIEDDGAIRQGVADALTFYGYVVIEAADGDAGMERAVASECDLLLLDLVLPGAGGLDILQRVRDTRPTLPVIILTALGEEADRVKGLKLGADDYVVKPFGVDELIARVEAVLRRSPQRPTDVLVVPLPNGRADLERCEVRLNDGRRADLSQRETALLRYLVQHAGRAVTRQEILANVWRLDPKNIETRTIDMHITRLREKLGDDGDRPQVICTVRGKGYRFGLDDASAPA